MNRNILFTALNRLYRNENKHLRFIAFSLTQKITTDLLVVCFRGNKINGNENGKMRFSCRTKAFKNSACIKCSKL